jgi:hypothetical protein
MTNKFTFTVSSGTVFSNGWYAEDDDDAKKTVAAAARICQKGLVAELEHWQFKRWMALKKNHRR